MRTADLKAGTEYATCDGRLIVPVEPIHANWYRVYDAAKNEWTLVDGGDKPRAKADPWGGCHTPKSGQPSRRRSEPGVLMDRCDFDRDGKRTGEPERLIVSPKDIAGTWRDYLVLYGDVVRRTVDDRTQEAERSAAIAALKCHYAERFGVRPRDVTIYDYSDRRSADVKVQVELREKPPASRAKNPPSVYVRLARSLGLSLSARVGDA